jgi:hypothetical protein
MTHEPSARPLGADRIGRTAPRTPARQRRRALLLAGFLFGCGGTTIVDDGESDPETPATPEPTPDYTRSCQPEDFQCFDLNCGQMYRELKAGACYKRCDAPDQDRKIWGSCDEPARPYCSRVSLMAGGDYVCNESVTICTETALEPLCD